MHSRYNSGVRSVQNRIVHTNSVTRRNEIPSKTRSTFEVTLSAKKMEVPPEFITAKHLQTCLQMHCKYQQRIFYPFQFISPALTRSPAFSILYIAYLIY